MLAHEKKPTASGNWVRDSRTSPRTSQGGKEPHEKIRGTKEVHVASGGRSTEVVFWEKGEKSQPSKTKKKKKQKKKKKPKKS